MLRLLRIDPERGFTNCPEGWGLTAPNGPNQILNNLPIVFSNRDLLDDRKNQFDVTQFSIQNEC
jgi:hypothetical protein